MCTILYTSGKIFWLLKVKNNVNTSIWTVDAMHSGSHVAINTFRRYVKVKLQNDPITTFADSLDYINK